MSKFVLLFLFLGVLLSWIYEPYTIDPKDERIDQYRPSLKLKTNTTSFDSVRIVQSSNNNSSTAFYSQAMQTNLKY